MNMEIIMPIGISGSGKSRLYKMRYSELPIVSPDLIRKELTGNISDQSRNKEVFKEAFKRIDKLVAQGQSLFYDATNLNTNLRKDFVNKFKGTDVKITYVVLPADITLSMERIKNDIDNNVDRSKVPSDVILHQFKMYKETIKNNFDGENVQNIIYIKPGELD